MGRVFKERGKDMEDQELQDVSDEQTGEDEEKPSKPKLQVQQRVYDMMLYAYPALDLLNIVGVFGLNSV